MSPPILTLGGPSPSSPSTPPKATPHLLPCRVHHNGSIEPIQPFWQPEKQPDGTSTSYFRGRKLHGTPLPLPSGYRGVVAAAILPPSKDAAEVQEGVIDLEDPNCGKPAQGRLDVQAEFDEVVMWGHEVAVTTDGGPAGDGGYVRGMEEWVALAGEIHSYPNPDGSGK
ncbi:ribonuclease H2 non-catalytic subunit-domain-containing protein [Schizothecium vesticola]|uniref:Ribonuclease H2 non-catalytic subunit-domain-containing protein n=1 Tax=Schizothecium vesticola TaxID=314040 RepID=A0AA40K3E4_9PEZI|nr:ribonuclease H2 non-catalytic subunit-domain-containing protein [Schizothecium vesticola]